MINRRFLVAMALLAAVPVLAESEPRRTLPYVPETVAKGLKNPWAMAFLPDGRMLVTERPGTLRIVSTDGHVSAPLAGLPPVFAFSQGGLLDIVLAPDFAQSRRLYISLAEARGEGATTSVLRADLAPDERGLANVEIIFRQEPVNGSQGHFGSRIVPARDGTLFIGLGERGYRDKAQDLTSLYGKVVRINPDGSVPGDNPFVGNDKGIPPAIYSYGHRNIQGAALHPVTGRLWTVEHGAKGGDEINRPEAGKNYGWPVITYGRDYTGAKIGIGTAGPGMEQPVHYWDPSIAPSGMMFYTGDAFPAWKGSLFVGALAGAHVSRLTLDGDRITGEERLLDGMGHRIRDIRQGPDGLIYLAVDANEGLILRLVPGR
ncbi:MAG: PQQ-dependent sugar dehydrogenase [Proteobacteria bacterium]|nr:PQQ-dependent sugar dehydrogenase [Pseudomonadota bacterium]